MTLHDQRHGKLAAFVSDDPVSAGNPTILSIVNFGKFVSQTAKDIGRKWKTVLCLIPVFLGFTRGGRNILSCLGWDFDARYIAIYDFEFCTRCTYGLFLPTVIVAISMLIWAAAIEARSIRSIVDVSVDESITEISSTIIVLIFGAYCLIEVLFGIDEGYNWASDFVVAFVATWALRLIFSWDDHARKIAGEKERAYEKQEAEKEVKKFGDEWFVT